MSSDSYLRDSLGTDVLVKEASSCNIKAQLEFDGVDFDLEAMNSLTLTLYDTESNTLINDREDQDILNANGATVSGSGLITIELDEADNIIVSSDDVEPGGYETHVARLDWTWNDGDSNRKGRVELAFLVEKLHEPV